MPPYQKIIVKAEVKIKFKGGFQYNKLNMPNLSRSKVCPM